MYSLDVNFLKDRPDYQSDELAKTSSRQPRPVGEKTPLLIGAAVGIIPLALVGGLWLVLQHQNSKLVEEQARVTAQLEASQAKQQEIVRLNQQITLVQQETQALATVFNQIKPWSAMLQDIRNRVPPGVQIQTVQQTEVAPAAAPASGTTPANQASAEPRPVVKLEINGTARSFDDVNYFLLTLGQSPFFKSEETQLVSAELVNNPAKLELPSNQNQSANQVKYELPKVVDYKIQTNLSDVPASELLKELDSNGAVGLVARIKQLQEQGVIQP
ncbi:MAG: PilN domain-containing protein [Coleofasciculaceae cyanobacterium]